MQLGIISVKKSRYIINSMAWNELDIEYFSNVMCFQLGSTRCRNILWNLNYIPFLVTLLNLAVVVGGVVVVVEVVVVGALTSERYVQFKLRRVEQM